MIFHKIFSPSLLQVLISFLILIITINVYSSESNRNAKHKAIEFDPDLPWLNVSRPLALDDLQGKIVILDFWTYGCINCIHVLSDLKKLAKKYGNQLAIIGIHTPKFKNEENIETLRNIIVRYDIHHPVVNDVNSTLGSAYGMRAWPTQFMLTPEGFILGRVTGENHYQLFDQLISDLIKEHQDIMDISPLPLELEKDKLATSLLAAPGKIAVSEQYTAISDSLHHRIILTDHTGKILKIFGGIDADLIDGDAKSSRFHSPQGLAFSDQGLFVADTGNHVIRYINLSNDQVQTVAGTGKIERYRYGQFDALSIGLASPWGLALRDNILYIAMAGSHQIWRYNASKGTMSPWAGSGREGIRDGALKKASFSQPSGLSILGDWLFVADSEASAIRRIHLTEEQVETIVGTGLFDFGDKDGPFKQAQLQHSLGIAALDDSRLLIVDTYNHKLKLLNLETQTIETLSGDGKPGREITITGEVQLNEPGGLAILDHKVLIADTNNHRILFFDLQTQKTQQWELTPAESDKNKPVH